MLAGAVKELSSVLGEALSWLHNGITAGVVGAFLLAVYWAQRNWARRPFVQHHLTDVYQGGKIIEKAIVVTVYNRAPEPIRFWGLVIEKPDGLHFQMPDGPSPTFYFIRDIPPFTPNAPQFPSAAIRIVIGSWSGPPCSAVIAVCIRSSNKWIAIRRSRISIKLVTDI